MQDQYTHGRRNLQHLFEQTPVVPLGDGNKIVFFSDLHMGNGGHLDDFAHNAEMFSRVLNEYYNRAGYTLVLNGDIEELQRFRLSAIMRRWSSVYELFNEFGDDGRLLRLVGNHDLNLAKLEGFRGDVRESLRFRYNGGDILVFHGHQTAVRYERYNSLIGFTLRYFANPLRIRNSSVAHSSVRRFRTERIAYDFASESRVMTIMGHTHRPLFESMSKVDTLRFEIERLCRKYPRASDRKQKSIEETIALHKQELKRINEADDESARVSSLYNANLLIPCTFNSGTVIGKRGMTCLEIHNGKVQLVHWFDARRTTKHLEQSRKKTTLLPGTSFHRVKLKGETLNYIFTRIRLLAGS